MVHWSTVHQEILHATLEMEVQSHKEELLRPLQNLVIMEYVTCGGTLYLNSGISNVGVQDLLETDGQTESMRDVRGQSCSTAATAKHQTVVVLK